MLLKKGRVAHIGETAEVISTYVQANQRVTADLENALESERRRGTGLARFSRIDYCNKDGKKQRKFHLKEAVCFHFEIVAKEVLPSLKVMIHIKTENEQEKIIVAEHHVSSSEVTSEKRVRFRLP